MPSVNISIWTAWLNGNSFHVHSHTLIGNAQGEHFSSRTLLTIPHLSPPSLPPPSLPPSLLAISPSLTFPLLPTAVFYPLFCYYISFWFFSHLPASEFLSFTLSMQKRKKRHIFNMTPFSWMLQSTVCLCPHRCSGHWRPQPVHHPGCVHSRRNRSPHIPGDLLHCQRQVGFKLQHTSSWEILWRTCPCSSINPFLSWCVSHTYP